ncbi:MAG: hypothetical protein EAY75_03690 [Bacteroidetes bacterium]|nr:MAG: hypothetical protein EAY75_03690 [Bacteroidota bacterium]
MKHLLRLLTVATSIFASHVNAQNVGIGTTAPVIGKLQINGNRDALPLFTMVDSSVLGSGSIRFTNLSRTAFPITIAGLSLGNSHAQSSLTIFSPSHNIAYFAGDGKVGINQISANTTLDVNGNTRSLTMELQGSGTLEFGQGLAKQADAGKICYSCFGEVNRLHLVGGGTSAIGTDRVIKLWSEGGVVSRGSLLPDLNSTYSLGRLGSAWRSSYTDSVWSTVFMARNSTINMKGVSGELLFSLNTSPLFTVNSGGITPSVDNDIYLGGPSKRFVALYAATGTIQTSDANLKTNIDPSPYGLNEVLQMDAVQFNWKADPNGKKEVGFLAQDIEKLIPEAVVNSGPDVPLGMKYSELIPVLVKAIQEQQRQIAALVSTIQTLRR